MTHPGDCAIDHVLDLAVVSQPHREQVMEANAGPVGNFAGAAEGDPSPC
jgi:hypothetical protein